MLVVPRPDYLATAEERVISERIALVERMLTAGGAALPREAEDRIKRLRGVLRWNIFTEYDRRFTEAHKHLHGLNNEVDRLKRQYTAFVHTRQAATQSYEGYDEVIRSQRSLIRSAREKAGELMARHGGQL
jgi:chromosome segregation ATPase